MPSSENSLLRKLRSRSWVMLDSSTGFTPLPGEQRLYVSPPRTTLSLQSLNKYPGRQPYTIQSPSGAVYLTNRRVLYLPSSPTERFQSFAAPILNLHDTHVAAPFFGPNVWSAIVQPVPGGHIPSTESALELKMTFKDGGAFDFHSIFERIKERLQQAVEAARESGHLTGDGSEVDGGAGPGALAGVDMNAVHLDELPAYEDQSGRPPNADGSRAAADTPASASSAREVNGLRDSGVSVSPGLWRQSPRGDVFTPPNEPPPGYEEVQVESVADELERRLRSREEEDEED